MDLFKKFTIKSLKLNRKRTIVTIIGIMLSVALITAVSTIYSSGIKSITLFEIKQKGNYHVSFSGNVDTSYFKNNRNIEDYYVTQGLGFASINSRNSNKPYAYVSAFSKGALENLPLKLTSGRLPLNDGEIIIPTHLKTDGGVKLNVGDEITLNLGDRYLSSSDFNDEYTAGEELINLKSKTYKVVGVYERFPYNIEGYRFPGYTFVTYLDKPNGDGTIYVKYTPEGVKNAYKATANILGVDTDLYSKFKSGKKLTSKEREYLALEESKSEYQVDSFNEYLIGLQTNPLKTSGVGGLSTSVFIGLFIIVFTSIFCIKNSFDISITEKIKQYGILKSVGATNKQIKRNVFYEAMVLGGIGILLGVLLGLLASYLLILISNKFLTDSFAAGFKLEFDFSLAAILFSIFLGAVTIYFSAFKGAKRASLMPAIYSIKNSADLSINPKDVKSSKIIKKIFGVCGDISYKNLKRNKKKYRTTVISITVSVFMFISLYSFLFLASASLKEEIKSTDYNISLTVYNDTDKIYKVASSSLIKNYTISSSFYVDINNPKFSKDYLNFMGNGYNGYLLIVSINDEAYLKYIKELNLNYDDIKDKGILCDYDKFVNEKNKTKYLKEFAYQKGDVIFGSLSEGDNKNISLEVGYVSKVKPFGLTGKTSMVIVPDSTFKNFKTNDMKFLYFDVNDADSFQEYVENIMDGENYSIDNVSENMRTISNLYTLIGIFLYGFIIVISLIGITNIFNTITTNMELRRGEFATLKSIGMTKREFNKMIRLESLFMGFRSLLFGIILGILFSYLIYIPLNYGAPYELPIFAILISILAVICLISVIMRFSVRKFNKQNIIETIRNENI